MVPKMSIRTDRSSTTINSRASTGEEEGDNLKILQLKDKIRGSTLTSSLNGNPRLPNVNSLSGLRKRKLRATRALVRKKTQKYQLNQIGELHRPNTSSATAGDLTEVSPPSDPDSDISVVAYLKLADVRSKKKLMT